MLVSKALRFSRGDRLILNDITMSFKPGILYGLLGPNGSGKSTLLKCLAGSLKCEAGELSWKGKTLDSMEKKEIAKTISLLHPMAPNAFDFTVFDIVGMGRFPHNTPNKDIPFYVEKALKEVSAIDFMERRFSSLSTGEKQRILIARSLATESPVLLLDEPTSALDLKHEREIWSLLRELKSKGKTILVTLHNLTQAAEFLDEALLLKEGVITAKGSPSTILTPSHIADLYNL